MSNEYYNDDDGGEGGGGFNLDPLEPGFGEQFARFLAQRDEYLLGSIAEQLGGLYEPALPTEHTDEARAVALVGWLREQGVDDAKALQVYQRSTELFDAHSAQYGATDELADASLAVAIEEARTLAQAEANADSVLGKLRGEFGDLDREQLLERAAELLGERPAGDRRAAVLAMRDAAAEQAGRADDGSELALADRWGFAHDVAAELDPPASGRQPVVSAEFKGDELAFAGEFVAAHEAAEGSEER